VRQRSSFHFRSGFVAAALAVLSAGTVEAAQTSVPSLLDRAARLAIRDMPLSEALHQLAASSEVAVAFSPISIPADWRVDCRCEGATVSEALDRILPAAQFEYLELADHVFVLRRVQSAPFQLAAPHRFGASGNSAAATMLAPASGGARGTAMTGWLGATGPGPYAGPAFSDEYLVDSPRRVRSESTHRQAADTMRISLLGQALIRNAVERESPESYVLMREMLSGSEIVFTNLEAAIEARPGQARTHQRMVHNARPEVIPSLSGLHVNLLALSNNHSFDLGAEGILGTIEEVRKHGIAHAGTGRNAAEAAAPAIITTSGGRVALIALASGSLQPAAMATANTPGVNALRLVPEGGTNRDDGEVNQEDAARILESIRTAAREADHVIVYQHNHYYPRGEERYRPGVWFQQWARAVIDAGATVFVAHGNPITNGVEIYRGRPILYGLGNFVFQNRRPVYYASEPLAWESFIADLIVVAGCPQSVRFRPITMRETRTWAPQEFGVFFPAGAPRPAVGEERDTILERLVRQSAELGTVLEVRDGAAEIRLPTGNCN
jgi:poly-gamma-glutamate capsule biosynthesis protein CapA/YwtB (metallophosphatase superfamily)